MACEGRHIEHERIRDTDRGDIYTYDMNFMMLDYTYILLYWEKYIRCGQYFIIKYNFNLPLIFNSAEWIIHLNDGVWYAFVDGVQNNSVEKVAIVYGPSAFNRIICYPLLVPPPFPPISPVTPIPRRIHLSYPYTHFGGHRSVVLHIPKATSFQNIRQPSEHTQRTNKFTQKV